MSHKGWLFLLGLGILLTMNVYVAFIIAFITIILLQEKSFAKAFTKQFKRWFSMQNDGEWKNECLGLRRGYGSLQQEINILHKKINDQYAAISKRKANQIYQSRVGDALFAELLKRDPKFDKIKWLKQNNLYKEII